MCSQVETESAAEVAALGARLHVVEDELRAARSQLRERAATEREDASKMEVAQAELDTGHNNNSSSSNNNKTVVVAQAERDGWQHRIDEAVAAACEQREMVELLETRLAASRAAEAAWFDERRVMHLEAMRVKHQV